jgi:hypothetical protein
MNQLPTMRSAMASMPSSPTNRIRSFHPWMDPILAAVLAATSDVTRSG